ncbi:MAG: hypothetical protein ACT4PU_12435 [Planctomycetota bacterium]
MSPRLQRRSLQWISTAVSVFLALCGLAWVWIAQFTWQNLVHLSFAIAFALLCVLAALRSGYQLLTDAGAEGTSRGGGWLERIGALEAVDPGLSMLGDDSPGPQDRAGGQWSRQCPYCNAEHKAQALRCEKCGQAL